jgi:hypothetical protein
MACRAATESDRRFIRVGLRGAFLTYSVRPSTSGRPVLCGNLKACVIADATIAGSVAAARSTK